MDVTEFSAALAAELRRQQAAQELRAAYPGPVLEMLDDLALLYQYESLFEFNRHQSEIDRIRPAIAQLQVLIAKQLAPKRPRSKAKPGAVDTMFVSVAHALIERFTTDAGNRGHSVRKKPTLDYYDNRRDGSINGRHYFGIYNRSF